MPLYDSLGASQFNRLPKMTSVPTTDDLRYLMSEAKKRLGKVVELPFEHPINHQFFLIKLVMAVGNRVPPSWTMQRGDGTGARILWSRSGEDVMIIQNKIKTDAQYVDDQQDGPAPANVSGGGGDQIVMGGTVQTWGGDAPAGAEISGAQPVMPGMEGPFNMQPHVPSDDPFAGVAHHSSSFIKRPSVFGERPVLPEAEPEPPPAAPSALPKMPLPPPVKLDMTLLNQVHTALSDPKTGLMTFAAYVFFLYRESARYQKEMAPLAIVVFEIALLVGGREMIALPEQAVMAVGQRIRTVCTPLDVVTHLGGGEFSAVLASTDGAGAIAFAEALKVALSNGPLFEGSTDSVAVVFGAASIPETCEHPEVLIAAARQAKELAKGSPDSSCVLFPVLKD